MSLRDAIQFHLLIRARNAAPYISRCIHSVQKQTYPNWRAFLFLDAPTDSTESIARREIADDTRWHVTVNPRRLGVAHNMWAAIEHLRLHYDFRSMGNDNVVAIVDGDDILRKNALRTVASAYESRTCWLTYGSYTKLSKNRKSKTSRAYPKRCDVMVYPWRASHLKTFRMQLLYALHREQWQDAEGQWLWAASDVALMLPLIYKIGLKHCVHIPKPIYVYRDVVEHKTNRGLQKECEAVVRRMWK